MSKEIKQIVLHLFIALVVYLLPWAAAFRVLRFATRFSFTQIQDEQQALQQMHNAGIADTPHLRRHLRLHQLIDLADFYKSHSMTQSWLRRYWRVSGDPLPDSQQHPAVLFITFHYGAGFWALRYFQERGLPMSALYRPPPWAKIGEKFNYYFFWWRLRSIARLTQTRPTRVGDDQSELRLLVKRLLRDKRPVGVMPDLPTAPEKGIETTILGKKVFFAHALLRVVIKHKIPVVLYTSVLDLSDGGRNLHLQLINKQTPEALAQALAQTLEQALQKDPTAWHFWSFADQILH